MSVPRPLSAFAEAVSQHLTAWLNVLGNPIQGSAAAASGKAKRKGGAARRRRSRRKHLGPRLAPPPSPTGLEEARSAATEKVRAGGFPANVRKQLESHLRELCEAHRRFEEEAMRSHAEGVREEHGVVVLNRPLPGASLDNPPEVIDRLARSLMAFQALANVVEATRVLRYSQVGGGRILDGEIVEVGIPTRHDCPPELPFARRAEKFRHRVLQSIAALRGASSAGQQPPDFQARLDQSLAWWEWYLHEETPPARRTVSSIHEAADALNELLREAETRDVLQTPLNKGHVDILKALLEAYPACVKQVDLEADESIGLTRRTISSRLGELREWGLVRRPHGEREGDAITPKGIAALKRPRAR